MTTIRSTSSLLAAGALAFAALGMTGAAQADDVYWSVGVSSPGVQVGVGNGRQVVVQQPVYSQPYPVYAQPYPVYHQRQPVYVQPPPMYMPPPRYIRTEWQHPGYGWGWRHGRGDGRNDHDRRDGRDGRDGRGDHGGGGHRGR